MAMETAPISEKNVETAEGVYRLIGTRVSLDSIVQAFWRGQTAESIARAFPVLTLEQVYGALAYYLAHKSEVDEYLQRADEEFEALRRADGEEERGYLGRSGHTVTPNNRMQRTVQWRRLRAARAAFPYAHAARWIVHSAAADPCLSGKDEEHHQGRSSGHRPYRRIESSRSNWNRRRHPKIDPMRFQ